MTVPGVEQTSANPSSGHHRTESNDSQATVTNDVANATPTNDRRLRKRAVSADDDDDDGAHDAKRFRVTVEAPAAPTTAATTATNTGSPTAAAPTSDSIFTAAAPAVVDNHNVDNGPDEVPVNGDELDAASHVEGCDCDTDEFSSSGDELEDEGPLPPFSEWNVVGPARLGYDQYADWVDRFGVAWRLDVVRAPRADATVQHYPGFPTWVWTNLGHVAQGVTQDANYVDVYGAAWLLTLFRPARPDGGRVPRSTTPAPGHAGPSNEANTGAKTAPSYDPACCCCRGCCCCPLAAADEAADDATPRAEPSPYRLVRLGPVHLGFDAHYIDRYGIAWRREVIASPWCDVDEASSSDDEVSSSSLSDEVSSLDDESQEAVPVDDKRSDGDVEDNTDDEVFEDAGATDAEDDGSDAGVEYEDEEELEYEEDDELEYEDEDELKYAD